MAASIKYVSGSDAAHKDVVLASFKNGRLQFSEMGNCLHPPEFALHKSVDTSDSRKKLRRTLVAEAQGIQYVGHNYGAEAPKANLACKYLVGVLDRKTNKMKVLDAQYFHMQPWLNINSQAVEETDKADETDLNERTYAEKQDALTAAFGSARKRRAVDSKHKSRVGAEALEKSAKTAVTLSKSKPTTPIKETMDSEGVLPPCDRSATIVQDVYKLDDVLAPHLRLSLQQQAEKLCMVSSEQLNEWQTKGTYSKFILDYLKSLDSEPMEHKQHTSCILLYIHYLIMMHGLKVSDLKKIPFEDDTPEIVKKHLVESFTQQTVIGGGTRLGRCLPRRMKDKILSHTLVLVLIIDDFRTALNHLSVAFKVGLKRLETHARALGCKVNSVPFRTGLADEDMTSPRKNKGILKVAVLSLPLKTTRTPKKNQGRNR